MCECMIVFFFYFIFSTAAFTVVFMLFLNYIL